MRLQQPYSPFKASAMHGGAGESELGFIKVIFNCANPLLCVLSMQWYIYAYYI